MKYTKGVWYHRGQSYTTLHEALAAVWPQCCLVERANKKAPSPVPRILETAR